MGLLRSLAHTIFGILLLTALWVTALSFLSLRPASTAVITDLGVDALNPWLVTRHIGLDAAAYAKLQQYASAFPDKPLPLVFIKPQVMSREIKGLPYSQGVRLIYGRVAGAYYDGGPSATFNLPGPVAGVVQNFALFPEQYDSLVKTAPLPTWLQPLLLYTGLSPDTLTATGHQRITAILPKFWTAALVLAGVVFLLNLLGRRNPVRSLALAVWHGSWPTLAIFGVLWLIGTLYPTRVQSVAGAFGVVAGAFLPVYGVAAALGIGAYLISRFAGSLLRSAGKPAAATRVPVAARASRAGYGAQRDDAPAYVPGRQQQRPAAQPPTPQYQPGGRQDAGWNPPPRQAWEPPRQSGWGDAPTQQSQNPRQPAWNQPRPWDAPDPNAAPQGGQRPAWEDYQPSGPDDPTAPRW